MSVTFHRTQEHLLIKYIDDAFNIFTCNIQYNDKFVIDYCNNKLEILDRLLQNYIIEKHNDYIIILKIEEPIRLYYVLNKQPTNIEKQYELILSKLKDLDKENKILKEKLKDSKFFYIEGYTFPINKDIQQLDINLFLCPNIKPCNTINLSALHVCKNLTKFGIDLPNITTLDLTPLQNLLELTIINDNGNIKSVLGFKNIKKLNYLKFTNCCDIDIQKSIFENCTSLQELYISGDKSEHDLVIDLTTLQYTLERLTLHYTKECKGLEKCKLLKYFHLNSSTAPENIPYKLDNLHQLEEIILYNCTTKGIGCCITRLTNCVNLKKIKILNLEYIPKTDYSVFKYLETIDITGCCGWKRNIININENVKKIGF